MSALTSLGPSILRRGGARIRADRVSNNLTERQAWMLLEAAECSLRRRTPYNRFITIAWERGGLDAKDSVETTGQFIKAARDWLHCRGERLDWAWVQESGPGNAHCHILLHVPRTLDPLFRPMPLRWVKRLLGGHYGKGVLQSQRLVICASPDGYPPAQRAELLGKVHYMLKTAPAASEQTLGMVGMGYKSWGRSCLVHGKRCAVRPRSKAHY